MSNQAIAPDSNGHATPTTNAQLEEVTALVRRLLTSNMGGMSSDALVTNSLIMSRAQMMQQLFDPRRNVAKECGWPETGQINPQMYRDLHDRDPIANRVNELFPKESWQVLPELYEDEDSENQTAFETAWDEAGAALRPEKTWSKKEENSPIWSLCVQADIAAGIGHFGIILLGVDDGGSLWNPIDRAMVANNVRLEGVFKETPLTVNEEYLVNLANLPEGRAVKLSDGQPLTKDWIEQGPQGTEAQYNDFYGSESNANALPGQKKGSKEKPRWLFARVFDESQVQVVQWENNIWSPRYGRPVRYLVSMNDSRDYHTGSGLSMATVSVHWTRVVHIVDTPTSNPCIGTPRTRPVLNPILDAMKIRGASSEGYWKSAFAFLHLTTQAQLGGEVTIEKDDLKEQIQKIYNSLQRQLITRGMDAQMMAPTVSDPTNQHALQIETICIKLGCPVRVFRGSERGELASSQDDQAWNDRLNERRNTHNTPRVVQPLVDRLILIGVLPEPEQTIIKWPDLTSLGKQEKATIFSTRMTGYAAYAGGNPSSVMAPMDMLTREAGYTEEEAQEIIDAAAEAQEEIMAEQQLLAEEQGFAPTPPDGFEKPEPPEEQPLVKVKEGEKLVDPKTGKKPSPFAKKGEAAPGKPKSGEPVAKDKDKKPAPFVRNANTATFTVNYSPDQARDEFGKWTTGGGSASTAIAKEKVAPPAGGNVYRPSVTKDANGDGVTDYARVGVPANELPPPPSINRMPNLTSKERAVETDFAQAYERNPDGMAEDYRQLAIRDAKPGEPPTFATDDAKVLSDKWSSPSLTLEQRSENRASYNVVLHQTANALAKRAFVQHLDTLAPGDSITVTVGGCGAGKGFALKNVPSVLAIKNNSKAVWDSAGDQNATENPWVQGLARERGLNVNYVYVHADPKVSWSHPEAGVVQRAANPKDGRMVDAHVFADSYAIGARNHAIFAEKNRDNPNARFYYLRNQMGQKPKLEKAMPPEALQVDRAELRRFAQSTVNERAATLPPHIVRGALIGNRIWQGATWVENADGSGVEFTINEDGWITLRGGQHVYLTKGKLHFSGPKEKAWVETKSSRHINDLRKLNDEGAGEKAIAAKVKELRGLPEQELREAVQGLGINPSEHPSENIAKLVHAAVKPKPVNTDELLNDPKQSGVSSVAAGKELYDQLKMEFKQLDRAQVKAQVKKLRSLSSKKLRAVAAYAGIKAVPGQPKKSILKGFTDLILSQQKAHNKTARRYVNE